MKLPTLMMLAGLMATSGESLGAPGPRARIVVIDPGHGGTNAGARGAGLAEKQVTLAISARVAEKLRARGLDVRLTRAGDRTMTLRQRVEIANRAGADVFVSVHANASPSRARRGFETYVLTARGIEIEARALRGDTAAPRPGIDRSGRGSLDPDIALVLDDVERGAAQWAAADLAARVQQALRERRGAEGDRGVRQDAHHVLLGATMPAILVEVGFLDHPIEGPQLADPAVQDQIAGAITEAIAASAPERADSDPEPAR